jgi:hypothetical protein
LNETLRIRLSAATAKAKIEASSTLLLACGDLLVFIEAESR